MDSLKNVESSDSRLRLNHNLINDERGAVFAADACAKVSNRVGLVDAPPGAGATNLVTGLVEALNAQAHRLSRLSATRTAITQI